MYINRYIQIYFFIFCNGTRSTPCTCCAMRLLSFAFSDVSDYAADAAEVDAAVVWMRYFSSTHTDRNVNIISVTLTHGQRVTDFNHAHTHTLTHKR